MTVPAKPGKYSKDDESGWGFSAADGNAIINKGGWRLFAQCHSWFDNNADKGESGFPESKAAYKLPTFKLKNGNLALYRNGVIAASARVMGAGNKPDIPADDLSKVKSRLKSLGQEFGYVVPWEKKKSVLMDEINKMLGLETIEPLENIANDFYMMDDKLLFDLRKSVEVLPEKPEVEEYDEQKKKENVAVDERYEGTFGFEVIKKSPDNLSEEEALNKKVVRNFIKSRGGYNPDEIVLIHGNPSSAIMDRDRDEIDPQGFIESLDEYMKGPSPGVILRQHNLERPVGKLLYHELNKSGDPYVIAYVDEKDTVKEIREGKLGAFSYYAKPRLTVIDFDRQVKKTTKLDMQELSIVTIPSNTGARFGILKSPAIRITDIEDITQEQEHEINKNIWTHIKDVLGMKPKEPDELKLYKSTSNIVKEWRLKIDEIETGAPLVKRGAKMARKRLTRFKNAIDSLMEVLAELAEEVKTNVENDSGIKKSEIEPKVKPEVDEVELKDIETLLDKKFEGFTGNLDSITKRLDELEKVAGIDPDTTLKKSITEDITKDIDKMIKPVTEFSEKAKELLDQFDERLKKVELTKSPSRLGNKNGEPTNKPKKLYKDMTPEEKEDFWVGSTII